MVLLAHGFSYGMPKHSFLLIVILPKIFFPAANAFTNYFIMAHRKVTKGL